MVFKRIIHLKTTQDEPKKQKKTHRYPGGKRDQTPGQAFVFSRREIKIVLEGLRGEESIAALCCKYDIHQKTYFKWSKDFTEAGKRWLSGDITREAIRDVVAEREKMKVQKEAAVKGVEVKFDARKRIF